MAKRSTIATSPPYPVEAALKELGANLRTARLRRRLTIEELAARLGVDRRTVADAEAGKPSTAIAVYVGLLWAMGFVEQLHDVADPNTDREGLALAAQREPKRARRKETLDNDF